MSAVPFTVGYDGLWSAECYTKESKRSLTLEQIAEVFSSIPCLQFLLVSVETLTQFKLLAVSATEMAF